MAAFAARRPEGLGGVDVEAGKIQRLINGSEVWEDEPEVIREYQSLYRRAFFLLRRDRMLRRLVEENGGLLGQAKYHKKMDIAPRIVRTFDDRK